MREKVSDYLSIVGAGAFIAAAFLFSPIAGLIVVGVLAFVFSYFLR
ncbi:MAG: hypothetical protein LBT37_06470 [Lactobacillaceae bacterium]|jgi:4-hydroxybenzoate polyprenyltransferase|nr:hypothetical protein [Lactobacillaceae bacterium]